MRKASKATAVAQALAAGPDGLMSTMQGAAEMTRTALLEANHRGIPLQMSIGLAAVETTVTGAIALGQSDGHETVSPKMMAMQAGLLLGAAWAGEELDRG